MITYGHTTKSIYRNWGKAPLTTLMIIGRGKWWMGMGLRVGLVRQGSKTKNYMYSSTVFVAPAVIQQAHLPMNNIWTNDVVEAHCYVVDIGQTDHEQIHSRITNNWCRTFQPCRPLSTAYKTKVTTVNEQMNEHLYTYVYQCTPVNIPDMIYIYVLASVTIHSCHAFSLTSDQIRWGV